MSNAAKHSGASEIRLEVRDANDWLEVAVVDDGMGFDPSRVDTANHFGLSLIAERVKALSGTVDIHTCLGSGTTVHALIPKGESNETPD